MHHADFAPILSSFMLSLIRYKSTTKQILFSFLFSLPPGLIVTYSKWNVLFKWASLSLTNALSLAFNFDSFFFCFVFLAYISKFYVALNSLVPTAR